MLILPLVVIRGSCLTGNQNNNVPPFLFTMAWFTLVQMSPLTSINVQFKM